MVWLQGWDKAPEVALAALASWRARNPGWRVHALDRESLADFLPAAELRRIDAPGRPPEAVSDLVRLELLHRYGGVWADATAICARSLDEWLPECLEQGFFAFERPGPERMVASWFLAASAGSYIVAQWREAAASYWREREQRDDYFWLHQLFARRYGEDAQFRALWDAVPKRGAAHKYHFGPQSGALLEPPTARHADLLQPPAPVLKLTHKLPPHGEGSLMSALLKFARADGEGQSPVARPPARRILVGWYGAFAGHGTVGDQFALEAAVARLVAAGHEIWHATAADLELPGARRVEWSAIDPASVDAVLFVCGPILNGHRWTQAFFAHFASAPLAGVSVSLMPADHPLRAQPFDALFARQGDAQRFGDIAVLAPEAAPLPRSIDPAVVTIGLALRGAQSEYGAGRCRWAETERAALAVVERLKESRRVRVVEIENHLARSGRSAAEIERQYAGCDLVITSRFHGAVAALRRRVPFIAIDQIEGGAEIYPLVRDLGWPHVFKIEDVEVPALAALANRLLAGEEAPALAAAFAVATREANRTLAAVEAWAASLPARVGSNGVSGYRPFIASASFAPSPPSPPGRLGRGLGARCVRPRGHVAAGRARLGPRRSAWSARCAFSPRRPRRRAPSPRRPPSPPRAGP